MQTVIRNIDWAMLRKQKLWLLAQDANDEANGLISLIDSIQDEAENSGIDPAIIFGSK